MFYISTVMSGGAHGYGAAFDEVTGVVPAVMVLARLEGGVERRYRRDGVRP